MKVFLATVGFVSALVSQGAWASDKKWEEEYKGEPFVNFTQQDNAFLDEENIQKTPHINQGRAGFFKNQVLQGYSDHSEARYHKFVNETFSDLFSDTLEQAMKMLKDKAKHDKDLREKREFLEKLYDVKSQTIYALKGTDEKSYFKSGQMLSYEDIQGLFNRYGIGPRVLHKLDQHRLWALCVRSLELPPSALLRVPGSLEEVLGAYQNILDTQIKTFHKRLEEDVFTFEMLTIIAGNPTKFDLKTSDELEGDVLVKLARNVQGGYEDEFFLEEKKQEEILAPAKIFESILQRYGYKPEDKPISSDWFQKLFPDNEPDRLLQRMCGALSGPTLSWNDSEDLSLEVSLRNKRRENAEADISEELMRSVYNILGRHLNKQVLKLLHDRFSDAQTLLKRAQGDDEISDDHFF